MSDQKEDSSNDQDDDFQPPTKMRRIGFKKHATSTSQLDRFVEKMSTESTRVQQGYDLQEHDRLQQLSDANI